MIATITTIKHPILARADNRHFEQIVQALTESTQTIIPTLKVGDRVVVDDSWENIGDLILLGKVQK